MEASLCCISVRDGLAKISFTRVQNSLIDLAQLEIGYRNKTANIIANESRTGGGFVQRAMSAVHAFFRTRSTAAEGVKPGGMESIVVQSQCSIEKSVSTLTGTVFRGFQKFLYHGLQQRTLTRVDMKRA